MGGHTLHGGGWHGCRHPGITMAASDLSTMNLNSLVYRWLGDVVWPERNFFWLAIIYGLGISLLSLATPISVQLLINSIAATAMQLPLFTLSATLFGLLVLLMLQVYSTYYLLPIMLIGQI